MNNDIKNIRGRIPVRPLDKSLYDKIMEATTVYNTDNGGSINPPIISKELVVDYTPGKLAVYVVDNQGNINDISRLHLLQLIYGNDVESYPEDSVPKLEDIEISIADKEGNLKFRDFIKNKDTGEYEERELMIDDMDMNKDNKVTISDILSYYSGTHKDFRVDTSKSLKDINGQLSTIINKTGINKVTEEEVDIYNIIDTLKSTLFSNDADVEGSIVNVLDKQLGDRYKYLEELAKDLDLTLEDSVVKSLQTQITDINSTIGSSDLSGLRKRIKTLEDKADGMDNSISDINDTIGLNDDSGLKGRIKTLENKNYVYISTSVFSANMKAAAESAGATLYVQIKSSGGI